MTIVYFRGVLFNVMMGMWILILVYKLVSIQLRDLLCQVGVVSVMFFILHSTSEYFVISGGEDCKLRLWSLKSGELLFEDKFSNSIISAMCYKTYSSEDDKLSAFLLSIL